MTLKVLKPIAISDANLVSTTVAEPAPGEVEYNPAATYSDGDRVIVPATHRNYELLPGYGPVTGVDPSDPANPEWVNVGPTVRYAAFDESIGSVTKGASPMQFVINADTVPGIVLQQLKCNSVRIQAANDDFGTYYDESFEMQDSAVVDDWWDFVFKPLRLQSSVNALDLVPLPSSTYTITISSTDNASDVEVGVVALGDISEYGGVFLGPEAGIINYGKTQESYGITTLKKGNYARRRSLKIRVKNRIIDEVQIELEELRDTLVMWIGDPSSELELLNLYGFYETFNTVVKYQTESVVDLQIRSLG